MYFEIKTSFSFDRSDAKSTSQAISEAIQQHRGSIVVTRDDLVVFSAPCWRLNGIAWFVAKQMPLGVSFGVIEITQDGHSTRIDLRVSLFWLRCFAAVFALLLVYSGAQAAMAGHVLMGILLACLGVFVFLIYLIAIVTTRSSMRKFLSVGSKN